MTSSLLPAASFSLATRFISSRSAAGGGIAASAAARTSPASLTNSGEKKSATISRSGLPVSARRRGGTLELERGLSELTGVDGLPRLLFERLRAFLGKKRGAKKKEDPGRREEHAHPHLADCSYSFFSSMAGRT